MLPAYYYLGLPTTRTGAYEKAIEPLQIYLLYETEDAERVCPARARRWRRPRTIATAVEALNQAVRLDRNQVSAYLYLGTSYLRLDNLAGAEVNLQARHRILPAIPSMPTSA